MLTEFFFSVHNLELKKNLGSTENKNGTRSELTTQKNGTRQNTLRTKRTEQERTL